MTYRITHHVNQAKVFTLVLLYFRLGPDSNYRVDSDEEILRITHHVNQAKAETLSLLYFRLGYCGSDEEVKALT